MKIRTPEFDAASRIITFQEAARKDLYGSLEIDFFGTNAEAYLSFVHEQIAHLIVRQRTVETQQALAYFAGFSSYHSYGLRRRLLDIGLKMPVVEMKARPVTVVTNSMYL